MNEIKAEQKVGEILPLLRSSESEHHGFIQANGFTFELLLKPLIEPDFPKDILLELPHKKEKHDLSDFLRENRINIDLPIQL
jgi:hypothetical protein